MVGAIVSYIASPIISDSYGSDHLSRIQALHKINVENADLYNWLKSNKLCWNHIFQFVFLRELSTEGKEELLINKIIKLISIKATDYADLKSSKKIQLVEYLSVLLTTLYNKL
jgi:hypothetical protein